MAATHQPASDPAIPDPGEPHRQRTRTCLSCGRPFASAHIGHRVCRRCKTLDAWKSGTADFDSHDGFQGRTTLCRTV
ncbi:hypothetical protein IGS68_34575 (plasmid) [Skermanella sp. TT6]|uniref:Uncharacterized protein n=1 Tax=Skermanella cutis TaxID=2775420 RepID=A0ABX7BHK1_9PROT|nr:hypothetical protein [Skermanella sp. TT6]QQP93850.1 hypothetical protein IGS68_34575 [Skermanella sp. TT6]